MLVHHLGEEIVVAPFDEVDELVDDQVLEAPRGLLRQFRFNQIRRASTLHAPHLVFIFLMRQSAA